MASLIQARKISSQELMTAHIRRIEEVNPALNTVVEPLFDSAMRAAKEADAKTARGEATGPLHGVPFSVKDSIDVAGVRTTAGTWGLREAPPAATDATLVARLRSAGAIPIVKTNLPDLLWAFESDNLIFGRTNNPYDLSRTAGGSSGGESALIAAEGSPLGLGSDAAGSVRLPAAFCGITALKPTSGRLSRTGHVPPASGWVEALWQIGPMARHAEDLQVLLEVLAGPDGSDFTSPPAQLDRERSPKDLRVAFVTGNGFSAPAPEIIATVEQAAQALVSAGADVHEAAPPDLDQVYDLELGIAGADGCEGLDQYVREIGSTRLHPLLDAGFASRLRPRAISAARLSALWMQWDRFRHSVAQFFTHYDVLLCPVYKSAALLHGESTTEENFRGFSYTMAWNVGGNPAATVRCGEKAGLPLNVQIVTARWNDRLSASIAKWLEDELGGWKPSPLFSRNEDERHR